MDAETLLRLAHVIGAAVLFGTGVGIAFFMVMAHRTHDAAFIAQTAQVVVIADALFTACAAVLQPVTGVLLAREMGWPLSEPWILIGIGLYLFVGALWLPVVWIQINLRELAKRAAAAGEPLSPRYHSLFGIWVACGVPAFAAMIALFWVMLARPTF